MNILLGLLVASTVVADVPEGMQVPSRPVVQNETSGACANMDVGANRFDVGNGVCVYSLGEYGWFYIKNGGDAHGATCKLSDQWCEGFSSKEEAIEASKK